MSDFFGKAGMPWHGVMFVRKPHGDEQVSRGEFVVSYIDGMMTDKREDGFATLSAVYLAIKKYKEDCPWITQAAFKSDGAGAYAGLVFTVGISFFAKSLEVSIDDAYTGESGKNKTQLDGHFAVKGPKIRRLVAAALQDILTPDDLYEANVKTRGTNEAVQLFQPDRSAGSTLDVDTKSVKQLSSMSHRHYEYGQDGDLEWLVLRQQTNLGDGLSVDASKLRKPDAAQPLMLPRLLREDGSTSHVDDASPVLSASAAREQAAANSRSRGTEGAKGKRLPIARTKAGREHQESLRAQARAKAATAAEQQRAAKCAAELSRCAQSSSYWCRLDPSGHPLCNRVYQTARGLRVHCAKGKHTEGSIKPFQRSKGLVAAGRGSAHDRDIDLVQQQLSEVTRQSVTPMDVSDDSTLGLQPADGFSLVFADGNSYEFDQLQGGWARAQRLPSIRITVAQLEFIYEAFTVGKTFDKVKLSPAEAHEIMKEVGTPNAAVAKRFHGHPYFSKDLGAPRFSRTDLLDEPKIKGYFGKGGAALKKQLERAQERGVVEEEDDDGELDEDEGEGGDAAPKRRRKKRSGGRQGGAGAADHLLDARSKLGKYDHDVMRATDGNTRQHLNIKDLKALLADASLAQGGKRGELITRARMHAATLVSRARNAGPMTDGADGAAVTTGVAPAGDGAATAVGSGGAGGGDGSAAAATTGTNPADGEAGGRAAVSSRTMPTSSLRTSALPTGLSLSQAKAAKVAAVFSTCGALADASDRHIREAISDGRLQGMGLPWLRRLHASLRHLRSDTEDAGTAMAVEPAEECQTNQDSIVMDLSAQMAATVGSSSSKASSSGSSSPSSSSSSELGSAIGTDDDADSDSSADEGN